MNSRPGDDASITTVHPDIIRQHILTKLDGATLVSASCASSELQRICSEENLWKNICESNWPSTTSDPRIENVISTFASGHRSFFSDSYPTVRNLHHKKQTQKPGNRFFNSKSVLLQQKKETVQQTTSELMSAVDVHYGDELIYSKVVVTETTTDWFEHFPLRIDLLDRKEIVPTPEKFEGDDDACMAKVEENMRVSWIIIDPIKKRAVNVSSLEPVKVRRQWITGEIQARFATVIAAGAGSGISGGFVRCGVDVTCGGKEGGNLNVREISMQVEDMEGRVFNGKEFLGIMNNAMEGKRVNRQIEEEKKMDETFSKMRLIWREKRQNMERRLDLLCIVTGVTLFVTFWMSILCR